MLNLQSDDFGQQRNVVIQKDVAKKGSFKGVIALLLSLLFFVPLAPLFAFVLGMSARRRSPVLGGCAIMLGLVFTAGQAFVGYRGYGHYEQMTGGPAAALGAGFTGNFAQFNDAFMTSSPTGALEAKAFVEELESRYGRLLNVMLIDPVADFSSPESLTAPRRYELIFEKGTCQAEAAFDFDRTVSERFLQSNLTYLTVHDSKRGDLTFPASEKKTLASEPTER